MLFRSESKEDVRSDEMAFFGLIMMGQAYQFLGDYENAMQHFYWAGRFAGMRNEHLLYLNFLLEHLGRKEELIRNLNFMLQEERINPWPNASFLIEDRAYHNTSDFLKEWRSRLTNTKDLPTISNDSFKFNPAEF